MEIPNSLYYLIGTLIVANIGTIGSVIVFGAKAIWWLAKLHSQVEETTKDVDAAHIKIREMEKKIYEVNH